MMPTLEEILDRFPTRSFIINVKDNLGPQAEAFARIFELRATNDARQLLVFGGGDTVSAIRDASPTLDVASRQSVQRCVTGYMLVGWSGYVPDSCRNTVTGMYADYAWVLWGWPHRFVERMEQAGTVVILTHPRQIESIHDLRETPDYARMIPIGYSGAVVTNRIDKIEQWMSDAR